MYGVCITWWNYALVLLPLNLTLGLLFDIRIWSHCTDAIIGLSIHYLIQLNTCNICTLVNTSIETNKKGGGFQTICIGNFPTLGKLQHCEMNNNKCCQDARILDGLPVKKGFWWIFTLNLLGCLWIFQTKLLATCVRYKKSQVTPSAPYQMWV